MARHENISPRTLADGSTAWRVVIRRGAGKSPYRKQWATLAEAIADRDEKRNALRQGRAVPDARTSRETLDALGQRYLAARQADGSLNARSLEQYASTWRKVVAYFGPDVPASSLKAADVQSMADKMRADGKAFNTVAARLALLTAVLAYGVADETLSYNVAAGIRQRDDVSKRTRRVSAARQRRAEQVDVDKVARFLAAAEPRYRIGLVLMLGLGLRQGEARGLTLDRVNFDTGAIRIDRQCSKVARQYAPPADAVQVGQTLWLTEPKRGSVRTVMASGEVLDEIRAHVDAYGLGPHGLIMSTTLGTAIHECTWYKAVERWRAAAAEGGEPFGSLTSHAMRHAYATYAKANGATPEQIAADLGHASIAVTYATYFHAEPAADASRSAGVLAKVKGARPAPSGDAGAPLPRPRGHLRSVG